MENNRQSILQDTPVVVPPAKIPWYRRIIPSRLSSRARVVLGVSAFLVFNAILGSQMLKPQVFESRAAENTAVVSLQPKQVTFPPDGLIKLYISSGDTSVAFAHITVKFDPKKVKLKKDAEITNTQLSKIISKTSYAKANTTGVLELVVGVDPAKQVSAPSGTFELAKFTVSSVTGETGTSSIQLPVGSIQIVSLDQSIFSVRTEGAVVVVDPPVPTAIPNTPTPIPTPVATQTIIPTPTQCVVQNGSWQYG